MQLPPLQAFVRGLIEQKLNVLIPISHQPRDLVTEIIADSSSKFPEFASCVRKRIRTFLKSYRRSRKLKDGSIPMSNGINKVLMTMNIVERKTVFLIMLK